MLVNIIYFQFSYENNLFRLVWGNMILIHYFDVHTCASGYISHLHRIDLVNLASFAVSGEGWGGGVGRVGAAEWSKVGILHFRGPYPCSYPMSQLQLFFSNSIKVLHLTDVLKISLPYQNSAWTP